MFLAKSLDKFLNIIKNIDSFLDSLNKILNGNTISYSQIQYQDRYEIFMGLLDGILNW